MRVKYVEVRKNTENGPILVYPLKQEMIKYSYFKGPTSDIIWVVNVLRTLTPQEPIEPVIAVNDALYQKVKAIGGKMFPIGAINATEED